MKQLARNPALDAVTLRRSYEAEGRVRIPELLIHEPLRGLHGDIVARDDWRRVINVPGGVLELSRDDRAAMSEDETRALDRQIDERACLGFQYRYEGLRIPEPDAQGDNALQTIAQLMASAAMLGFLEQVIGRSGLTFTEGQVTAYASGDFLTCHDDKVPGRDRVAAFVLGMTPRWRPEWGGLLLFHADDDSQVTGHVPRFNTLDLFSVPQRHSVSTVTTAAPGRRLAITGWLSTISSKNSAKSAACND